MNRSYLTVGEDGALLASVYLSRHKVGVWIVPIVGVRESDKFFDPAFLLPLPEWIVLPEFAKRNGFAGGLVAL